MLKILGSDELDESLDDRPKKVSSVVVKPKLTDDEIVSKEIDIIRKKSLNLKYNRLFFEKLMKKHIHGDRDYIICLSSFEGEGKTQPKGSKVLMINGDFKNIEDIKVGDLVLSPQENGTNIVSKVLKIHSKYSNENYDITELNRRKKVLYSCSDNHLIPINIISDRTKREWKTINIEAVEYSKMKFNYKQNSTSYLSFPIEKFYFRENCEIEPYTLGAWLGDGHFSSKRRRRTCRNSTGNWLCRNIGITSNDIEIINEITKYYDIMTISNKRGTTCKTYTFSLLGILSKQLAKYGLEGKLSGNKFIPKDALLSDIEYRKRLLAGLIDTDGTLSKTQSYSITTKSKQLSKDIEFLVHTLGGRCNIRKVKKGIKSTGFIGEYYHIGFYLGDIDIPFKLKRKIRNKKFFYKSANRISVDSVKSKSGMVYGFTLDSPSGWYVTDNWMITHNSRCANQLLSETIRVKTKEQKLNFLKYNAVYDPTGGELIKIIKNIKPKSVLWVDEAHKLLYKRNYNTAERKELNTLFSTIREKNLIVIFCIPDFYDLDIYFRNWRIKTWIYIPIRGLAVVFKKSNSPFSVDRWEQKKNQKIIENIEDTKNDGRLLNKTDMILALRRLKSYGLEFSFDDWDDPDVKARYLQYKDWGGSTPPEEHDKKELSEIEKNKKIAQKMFLLGAKTDEIADIIGKSVSTVRDYVREVRSDMKKSELDKNEDNRLEKISEANDDNELL